MALSNHCKQQVQHCLVPQTFWNVSPPEPALRFYGSSIRFLYLVREDGVEALHQSFRRAALDNLPNLIGQPTGNKLLQGGHAAQDDRANKPLYVML